MYEWPANHSAFGRVASLTRDMSAGASIAFGAIIGGRRRDGIDLHAAAAGETPIESASPTTTRHASEGNLPVLGRYSIYEARAAAAGLAFCFNAAIRVFAAGPEECGFCPVISRPLLTT
jgi:hypothetical protein